MPTPDIRVIFKPEGVKDVIDGLRIMRKEAEAAERLGVSASGSFVNLFGKPAASAKAFGDAVRGNALPSLISLQAVALRLFPALGFAGAIAGLVSLGTEALSAARNVGPLADTLGTTAEHLTILQHAARGNSATSEQLDKGLGNLNKSLRELNAGTQNQVDAFAQLGLTARDFEGLNLAQSIELIAKQLAKVDATKVDLDAIFGRDARKLIPLLQALARDGFGGLEKAARDAGAVISNETAQAGREFDDNLTTISESVKSVGRSLVAELLPPLRDLSKEFAEAAKKGGLLEVVLLAIKKLALAATGGIGQAAVDALRKPAARKDAVQSGSVGTGAGAGAVGARDPERRIDALGRLGKLQAQIRERDVSGLRAQAEAADQAAAAEQRLLEVTLQSQAGKALTQRHGDIELTRRQEAARVLFELERQVAIDKERQLKDLANRQIANAREREATIVEIVKQSATSQIQQSQRYLTELTRLLEQNIQRHQQAADRIKARLDTVLERFNKTDQQFGPKPAAAREITHLAQATALANDKLRELRDLAGKGEFEAVKKARAELDALIQKINQLSKTGTAPGEGVAREADQILKQAAEVANAADRATAAQSQRNIVALQQQIQSIQQNIERLSQIQITLNNITVPSERLNQIATDIQVFLSKTPFEILVTPRVQGGGQGFADGGRLGGTSPGPRSDNLLFAGTAGEFVEPVAAVRKYGLGFMESIRTLRFPAFADGGQLGGGASSSAPGDGGLMEITLNAGRRKVRGIFASRETAEEMVRALKSEIG